jgi:8-hydroxy-5-deazaflavin:NADPH oxidoreductase
VARLSIEAGYDVVLSNSRGPETLRDLVADIGPRAPAGDGQMASLDDRSETSSGLVQQHLSRARVVKVLNNITMANLLSLARPAASQNRSALPIAGDDAARRRPRPSSSTRLATGVSMRQAWRIAGGENPARLSTGTPYGGFANPVGTPAGEAVIRAALEHATR